MSKSMDSFQQIVEQEQGLKKVLSAGQMGMIAIGGAIGTGLFLGSGLAIGFAGPSVIISYAIGALIALILMGCLAEMTIVHPTSGSFGAYAEHYMGPWAGFMVRYAYWACNVLAIGTEVTAIGIYMKFWYPDIPSWFWISSFSLALVLINAFSVNIFGLVEYWFSVIKIVAIIAFIMIGSYVVFGPATRVGDVVPGLHHYTEHGGFLPQGLWGMWIAVIVAIFGYLGIEMIAVAAGEAHEPEKAIKSAVRTTLIRLALFYLLTMGLMLAIVPWTQAGHEESPFVKVMTAVNISGASGVVNFVVLIAALSAMNSQLYITTRMMFSLSCAGYAPKQLGRLNKRGIPMLGLLLSTGGVALATILSIVAPKQSFTLMMAVSMFGALFTWFMIFVTHFFFRKKWGNENSQALPFRMPGFPYLTFLGGALMLAIMITTAFTKEFQMTLVFGIPALIFVSVVYFVWYAKKTDISQHM
ncbi:amino acid permease [Limnohabitans curvus]|uniref:Amino acid permease n=1 Tax=Limnohabitans curvus TaxID=323423 RepID=A0A315EGS2_9BURK|nr:amino acid permease [Limnohabitans curvus]PUE56501.1 amino acid permease [Limnohabitans curvus]